MTSSWTDIIQAIAAIIAVPGAITAFVILFKRDKARESEIASLATIASQLTSMQVENEKRYKASKKPHFLITVNPNFEKKHVKLDFINNNSNTTIVSYKLQSDFSEFSATHSAINESLGKQSFWIALSYKNEPFVYEVLKIDYTTEEGYTFIQDIIIWLENGNYLFSPGPIIDYDNSYESKNTQNS